MATPQDHEVPLPFIRPKLYIDGDADRATFSIPVYLDPAHPEDKVKVPVKIYSGGDREDVEAFFITFFEYVNAMKKKELWQVTTFTQSTDVTSRINYFENTLDGNALSDWQAVRVQRRALTPANSSITTWRIFKEDVAVFIVNKVCKAYQDPFTNQRKYIRGRKLCHGLKVREQYERVQFTNNCLPMLLTRETMEAKSQGKAKSFAELWNWGALEAHDMPEVITGMIPEAWRQTYNVLAGGRDLDSEEMIRLLTTIENNPKFGRGVGDNRQPSAQWRGGARHSMNRSDRNYYKGRAPVQQYRQYYPSGNQAYRPKDERSQRYEAPLARERNTQGPNRFIRGSPAPFARGGSNRFGAGRSPYQPSGRSGRFDRSARPSSNQYHHYQDSARPSQAHAYAQAHYAQPDSVTEAEPSFEEQEQFFQDEDERQRRWEIATWQQFEQEQEELEASPADEQFLAEEDEWFNMPSEYNDEGEYL